MKHEEIKSKRLPIEFLVRGRHQPRQYFDPALLEELARSIKTHGLIEPIIVRATGQNQYEIIAGERRWRAAQLAGLASVRCEIQPINEEEAAIITLIENIQREDLNPMEEAYAYKRLSEEFGYTHDAIATKVGKSREKVTNILRLLKLDQKVQALIFTNKLTEGHGKNLTGVPLEWQHQLAMQCVQNGWSNRTLEAAIKKIKTPKQKTKTISTKDGDIRHIEMKLSAFLGNNVTITHKQPGGKIIIDYYDSDGFSGILDRIGYIHEEA